MSAKLVKRFPQSNPVHAGGVRAGKIFSRFAAPASTGPMWQALESSEDEAEPSPSPAPSPSPVALSLAEMIAADPVLSAMFGGACWADVLEAPSGAALQQFRADAEARNDAILAEEASIWDQPFGRKLEAHCSGHFDLSGLTEAEFEACMTWLYANGWHASGSRCNLEAYPADLPPRVWVADRFASLLEAPVIAVLADPAPQLGQPLRLPKGKKATVPRFCRAWVCCTDAACRYVHADTMPRLNEPCAFGAACGGTDPAKRALCIRMHPGETWTPELVVSRP